MTKEVFPSVSSVDDQHTSDLLLTDLIQLSSHRRRNLIALFILCRLHLILMGVPDLFLSPHFAR